MENTVKIVISGYGKMGHMIEQVLNEQENPCVLATEDIVSVPQEVAKQSVCIDFTTPDAIRQNYKFLAENFNAVVIGTTGWDDIKEEVFSYFRQQQTTLVYASNFSIGVNVFFALTEYASTLLAGKGYMPYIEEKHHQHKLDKPSGTAKSLAALVQKSMQQTPDVAAIRCGEISGIHTVGFEGLNDRITLVHEAFNRKEFAIGAVSAANQTASLPVGVYEFKEIVLM